MTPFVQYKPWMTEHYGAPLFRVPVQIAGSCPHGRCAFCSENGSKAQQTQQQNDPLEQAEEAIRFATRRYRAKKFMLYIQAFTADLTDAGQQQIIRNLLKRFQFDAISIGTRPDCLPNDALQFLSELAEDTEVWIELGVQTACDQTLERINRGHDWASSKDAIQRLAKNSIHAAPHIILGLPGETAADWNRTAEELADLPISGIKIHNLHIVRGTELAEQYAKDPFPVLSHWEYAEGLIPFLQRIPADIPVMRISTDTPDDQLIAPHWHLEKGQFLDYVIQQMECRQISQGDLTEARCLKPKIEMKPVQTDDGSVTFFSPDWKEHYHTKIGARMEAYLKFISPSQLALKLKETDLNLLDVCFGLGNNSLAALCAAEDAAHRLDITALEMDKRIVRAASENFIALPTDPVDWKHALSKLLSHSAFSTHHSSLSIRWGDARYLIQKIPDQSIDLVFHDPFSSQHCPELWTVEFFQQLYRVMKPDGMLLTYSSALPVRGAMREAGLHLAETEPGHRMNNGTAAARSPEALSGLSPIGFLDPRRSIPYQDEFLCATSKAILRRRQEAVEQSNPGD